MNVVFILSDQHNPFFTGAYGNERVETPTIDRIARQGVRFENAYCNSPLCVPTRAALFTGRYVFENACWDNCIAWDGAMKGWSHFFKDHGVLLTTIGKLDFAKGTDHGVESEILPIHRGSRDIHSLFRENAANPPRWSTYRQMNQSGPRDDLTEETFNDYKVSVRAREWLENDRPADRPWVLNVNFTQPHPGWPCPPDLWEKWNARVKIEDLGEKYFETPESLHPYHYLVAHGEVGLYATDEEVRRGHAAYMAHCELVDNNVRRVVEKLEELGILDDTLVMYVSDHGENLRAHGTWGKLNMYEDSIRVPFCMTGPGIAPETTIDFPVSHLDVFPTICEAVGLEKPADFRGISLLPAARGDAGAPSNEYVLSEKPRQPRALRRVRRFGREVQVRRMRERTGHAVRPRQRPRRNARPPARTPGRRGRESDRLTDAGMAVRTLQPAGSGRARETRPGRAPAGDGTERHAGDGNRKTRIRTPTRHADRARRVPPGTVPRRGEA